jgi:hypothetical protein
MQRIKPGDRYADVVAIGSIFESAALCPHCENKLDMVPDQARTLCETLDDLFDRAKREYLGYLRDQADDAKFQAWKDRRNGYL